MKISSIEVTQTKNLGNYENIKLTVRGELSEDDNVNTRTGELADYVNFKLKEKEYTKKYEDYKRRLLNGGLAPADELKLNAWVNSFESMLRRIQALDFYHAE